MNRENTAIALMQKSWARLQDGHAQLDRLKRALEQAERELEGAMFLIDGPETLDPLQQKNGTE